jgi:hypothetical protein
VFKANAQIVSAILILLCSVHIATQIRNRASEPQNLSATTSADQDDQKLRLSVPKANWVPLFFNSLETHTKKINLPSLKTVRLPSKDDLEIRFWMDGLPDIIDGIIIRRISNQWSAIRIRGTSADKNFPLTQKKLDPPKSGWNLVWEKLVSNNILTLPDASESKCNVISIDGLGYVIETNFNWDYRTYYYRNPQLAKCNEAKRITAIIQLLFDEFELDK